MFIVRILIAVVLLFILEFYFYKKTKKSFGIVFPNLSLVRKKLISWTFFIILNYYPVFLIANWTYSDLTNSKILVPQDSFFDWLVLYPFWFLFLLVVQTDLLFLLIDILKFLLFPLRKKYHEKFKSYEAKIVIILTAFFIIYIPFKIIYDYNKVSLRIVEYKKENLPKQLQNFKITFISDVQADRYTDAARLNNYINKVNATNPDLVLMGGDVITSTPDYINESAEFLGKIKSKYGVYSCVGDHDNWAYRNNYNKSLNEVESALKKHHVEMIDNGFRTINVKGAKIGITFITYTYANKISMNLMDSLSRNGNKEDLNIFLTHQPREFLVNEAHRFNYDLMLTGHTHGGQITFLFPFINLTPTLIETPYVKGDFHFGKMLLVVTRGLGMSLAPVRYNSTPEITVIVLEKK